MTPGSSINGTAFIPGVCGPKPTSLGYQCSWSAPDGVTLHWSYNVSHPPINRCTANNAAENAESRNLWDGNIAVHMALQAVSRVGVPNGGVGKITDVQHQQLQHPEQQQPVAVGGDAVHDASAHDLSTNDHP